MGPSTSRPFTDEHVEEIRVDKLQRDGHGSAALRVPLLVLLAIGAQARAEPTVEPAAASLVERLKLGIGLSTFGDLFPVSTMKVPGTSRGQLSLLGGIRFSIGTHLPDRLRVMAVIEAGYASAGYLPGRAADGVMEGAGLEVSLEYFARIKPFVRFMYNAVVVPLRTNAAGTLASNAYFFSAGARLSIIEVHLAIGRDFAGGLSPGFGLSLGWQY